MIRTKMAGGIFWAILMRWSMKAIGLINTIILARLLSPEDFGVVAMAALFIGLIEEMSAINVSLMLIRTPDNTREHNDTAWTVGILQGFLVAMLMVLFAPVAASYFEEVRIIDVIYVLAILKISTGFTNVGLILARKELRFSFDFKIMLYWRLIRFAFVVSLAFLLKSYWAMIFGSLAAEFVAVALSYWMHPYRPSICFKYLREYYRFAFAMIPMAVAKLLNNKIDVVLVGGNAGTALMGIYNVSSELSSIFTRELVTPASRGLYPNLSLLSVDRKRFIDVYKKLIATAIIICLPLGVGIWIVADDMVLLLLGQKWEQTTVYLKWLAIFGAVESITFMISEHPLIALGLERKVNVFMWFRLGVRVICVAGGYLLGGIEGIAIGMTVSAILSFFSISFMVFRLLKIKYIDLLTALFRPIISVIFMAWLVGYMLVPVLPVTLLFSLILKISIGALSYTMVMLTTWYLNGCPDGVEKMLVDKIYARIRGNTD